MKFADKTPDPQTTDKKYLGKLVKAFGLLGLGLTMMHFVERRYPDRGLLQIVDMRLIRFSKEHKTGLFSPDTEDEADYHAHLDQRYTELLKDPVTRQFFIDAEAHPARNAESLILDIVERRSDWVRKEYDGRYIGLLVEDVAREIRRETGVTIPDSDLIDVKAALLLRKEDLQRLAVELEIAVAINMPEEVIERKSEILLNEVRMKLRPYAQVRPDSILPPGR